MRELGFVIFCALAMLLCLLPLPWHWRARNSGTLLYLGWTFIGCFVFFVNSIVWAGNMQDVAPVWCDISTRLIIGLSVGITASSLCINRQIYHIATVGDAKRLRDTKTRDLIVNLSLGIGLPVIVMALYYVVQSNRYDIIEDIGCWPTASGTLLDLPMVLLWPIIIGVASFIYAGLTIRAFIQTRRQFSHILSESETGFNMSRYFRLMGLAATEMLFSLPLALYFVVANMGSGSYPWISWAETHKNFGQIAQTPHEVLQAFPEAKARVDLNRWLTPGGAFVFFLYFGLSNEANKEYKRVYWRVMAWMGIKPGSNRLESTLSQMPIVGNNEPIAEVFTFTETLSHFDTTQSMRGEPMKVDDQDSLSNTIELKMHDLEAQR